MKGGNSFMIINKNLIKIIGTTATILGFGATLVSGWVSDKQMDDKINKKIGEALAKRMKRIGP